MGKAKQTIKVVTTRTRTQKSSHMENSNKGGNSQSRCPTCGKYMSGHK